MSNPPPAARAGHDAADRSEPRAARTRSRVLDAVRSALQDGPVESLSVSDLCRRAGVNRATFYGHWPDARAAAVDALTGVVDRLATVDEEAIAATADPTALARLYEEALARQLAQIAAERATYRRLIDSALFEQQLRLTLHRRAELAVAAMAAAGVAVPGGAEGVAATHLAGGTAATTLQWIRSDGADVEHAVRLTLSQLPAWWPAAG